MQQYEQQRTLACTATASLDVVRGATDGQLHVIKRVRFIPCRSKEEQMALAYAVQEARLLMHLRHPNIVRARDFFIEAESHCLVLEFCECGDLKQRIDAAAQERRSLDPGAVLGWIWGIANAAKHFHREGVVHRDLKPANIFLVAHGGRPEDVRVGDFGAARQIHAGQGAIRAKPTGTKNYMVRAH